MGRARVYTLAMLMLMLFGRAHARQVVVGGCLQLPQFSTIQAAIDNAGYGATIFVCPGTYPEQLMIQYGYFVIKGVSNGSGNAAIIVPPPTGLQGNIPAQITVSNTNLATTISDLIIDGLSLPCNPNLPYGIYLEHAKATISNVVIRNVTGNSDPGGSCPGRALGAFLNSTLIFKNNQIHDSTDGVTTDNSNGSVSNNTIQVFHYGIHAGAGIGSISQNFISAGTNCIWPSCQAHAISAWNSATVSNNTIEISPSSLGQGIAISSGQSAKVTGNNVTGGYVGVSLSSCANTTVTGNIISNSAGAAFSLTDVGLGTNMVTKNTVNEGVCAFWLGGSQGDTLTPNTFHNTVKTQPGACN